jgi:hypothetical protein
MTQCFELLLLPGIDHRDFEKAVWTEVFSHLVILRRNVRATAHRLFRNDKTNRAAPNYIWLVFAELVGGTPETAGDGPEVLASDLAFLKQATDLLARYATISSFTEIVSN